ncbi:MAG: 4Fe-4S dicluster domain-containing protein [Treponema sp.]|nr:4Fe-4S dicluster domain-containing protein [Treponema sp.]
MARKGKVVIDRELCKGCGLCIRACPVKVLDVEKHLNMQGSFPASALQIEKCTGCGNCFAVCPEVCIEVFDLEEEVAG